MPLNRAQGLEVSFKQAIAMIIRHFFHVFEELVLGSQRVTVSVKMLLFQIVWLEVTDAESFHQLDNQRYQGISAQPFFATFDVSSCYPSHSFFLLLFSSEALFWPNVSLNNGALTFVT